MSAGIKRTRKVIVGALSLGASAVISNALWLVIIGITARYFSPEQFGLWSILISITGLFITGFDLGFGNALRNKLSQIYSQKNPDKTTSQIYFFSIFYCLILSATVLSILFLVIKPFVPWGLLVKSSQITMVNDAAILFTIGASMCVFNTAFTLYMSGFFSYQESHWNALLGVLSKLAILLFIWLLIVFRQSFFSISVMFFLVTLASSAISLWFFLIVRKWRFIAVGFLTLFEKAKELWRKGAQFAFLQIFSTFLLYADLFVISKMLGLASVGDYFLVKRIYLLLSALQFTLLLPVWSAYTEAVESKDYVWTNKVLERTTIYTTVISLAGIIFLLIFGNYILTLWTGKHAEMFTIFLLMGIWNITYNWNNCFSVFLNSTGHLKIQAALVGISAAIFVPLALLLGRKYGIAGVCGALIIVNLPLSFSNPIQSYGIIRKFKKQVAL